MISFKDQDLIIFTHVVHYVADGRVVAHGPYVKEVNQLAVNFKNVVLVCPFNEVKKNISPDNIPYEKQPEVLALPVLGGSSLGAKLQYVIYLPVILVQMWKGVARDGILHPRAPGSVAFFGLLVIFLFGRAKYKFCRFAGEWDAPSKMPLTSRMQRWLLERQWFFNGPVFVYSEQRYQNHITPCFTSSLTQKEVQAAGSKAMLRNDSDPFSIVFAGRLVENKGLTILLQALARLTEKGYPDWTLHVLGDGELLDRLKTLAKTIGISEKINWHGWVSPATVTEILSQSHIVCQPTLHTESWGKMLQEGMAFGCVPVASAVGGLKKQLSGRPALLFEPGDVESCSLALQRIISTKSAYLEDRNWSLIQAQKFSLDGLVKLMMNRLNEFYNPK